MTGCQKSSIHSKLATCCSKLNNTLRTIAQTKKKRTMSKVHYNKNNINKWCTTLEVYLLLQFTIKSLSTTHVIFSDD